METSTKNSLHIRSNSFPSAPHPLVSQVHDHLQILKDSEVTTASFSLSSISQKLNGLQDLLEFADKLLQLPTIQQDLASECSEKWIDDLLEGSLRLLDICGIAQDYLLQSKENMYEIRSALRRKGADSGFTVEGGKYLASRKKMKKAIHKALGNLKGIKFESNKDKEVFSVFSILKDAEAITMSSLESLLLFISDPKGQSKQNKWSRISKLMQPAKVTCASQESDSNEFVNVDEALRSLISYKSSEDFDRHVEDLEICIQDLEVRVEQLSRQLIRTRVSLLNILSH
ncbi:hypothetical protein Lal_00035065 [Lupinus albus]|uniref:Uncharacterized protein n=1 Tax=Lupinus albus TaxID=3870 RepID=A0A6A5PK95_LUPAL|nr:hypothetical protein Lalb_Chr03g0025551 [Lupinus albus]KAF1897362.1 hypothetical protein Lal_00035065 [Lupinus albus]